MLVSGPQMQAIDRYAIERLGIPSLLLMENAALRVIDQLDLQRRHSFAIFCGVGNNGGDGLAIARGLLALEKKVIIYLVGDKKKMSEDCKTQYRILQKMRADLRSLDTIGDLEDLQETFSQVNTLIDCLFGTGLSRDLKGMAPIVIEQMNESRIYTLSVDIPSGLDATSGKVYGSFVDADLVVCLQFKKRGLEENPYLRAEVRVVPIGIPPQAWSAGDALK